MVEISEFWMDGVDIRLAFRREVLIETKLGDRYKRCGDAGVLVLAG